MACGLRQIIFWAILFRNLLSLFSRKGEGGAGIISHHERKRGLRIPTYTDLTVGIVLFECTFPMEFPNFK